MGPWALSVNQLTNDSMFCEPRILIWGALVLLLLKIHPVSLEAAKMSQRKPNYWDASDNSDTDVADAADLAEQPESVDEHKRIEIYFPSLGRIKTRKLNQLKTDLRNKFNISTIEECQRTCVITVSGYGFDREDVLQEVRRYDSRAS